MQKPRKYFLHLSFIAWLGTHTIIVPSLLLSPLASLAQSQTDQPDLPIDAAKRSEVIEGVLKFLNDYYVFVNENRKVDQSEN